MRPLDVRAGRDQLAPGGQHPRSRDPTGIDGVAQRDIAIDAGMTEIAHRGEATLQVFARQLCAEQHASTRRHGDRQQQPRKKHAVTAAGDLGFRGHHDVEEQVAVTVDQTRQQRGAAEVDRPDGGGGMRLQLRRRTHFTDLVVFNQYRRGRQHLARARIEEVGRLHQRYDRRRLRRGLCGGQQR